MYDITALEAAAATASRCASPTDYEEREGETETGVS